MVFKTFPRLYVFSACRCVGWLLSTKRYILTIMDDCFSTTHPTTRAQINIVSQHASNLLAPSTPFFFNTLYDPYRDSCDFVRGYPFRCDSFSPNQLCGKYVNQIQCYSLLTSSFSLREGAPTAISHGLWLNSPDYDAPTQLVKPMERNNRYVDAVLTIPKVNFLQKKTGILS